MFKLITVEDVVQIPPHLFGQPRSAALEHVLNKRLSDRVLPGHGLVIGVWDIVSAQDDRLVRTTGTTSTRACFRLVVFAPFVGEAVFARVAGSTPAGLLAHLGFFDAVWVRKERLPRPVAFDPRDRVWVWRPTFDGCDAPLEYFMDASNESVVRVTAVEYDTPRERPNGPHAKDLPGAAAAAAAAPSAAPNTMTVFASLFDDVYDDNQGLGDPAWWYEGDADEDAEDGDDAEDGGDEDDVDMADDTNGDANGFNGDDEDDGDGDGDEGAVAYENETEYVAHEAGAAVEDEEE